MCKNLFMGVFYRYFTDDKISEIWIPELFSDCHPLKGEFPVVQSWQDTVKTKANILSITSLSHITHNREATAIRGNDGKFVFKPTVKVGKAMGEYDGSPVGKTFKADGQDTFKRILPDSPVFPGQISWWGISSTNCHETERICNFRAKLVKSKEAIPGLLEVNYLKDIPDSRYGNREFIVSLPHLMNSYKQSRTDCKDKEVCLKNAGTLRYRYEICYVIMVAMEGDVDGVFPSMFGEPHFKQDGLIDNNGKLIDSSITPGFQIMHPFSNGYFSYMEYWDKYSWETLAFALYFPNNSQMVLECPEELCREREIHHSYYHCTSTQPIYPGSHDWVCPNELH